MEFWRNVQGSLELKRIYLLYAYHRAEQFLNFYLFLPQPVKALQKGFLFLTAQSESSA